MSYSYHCLRFPHQICFCGLLFIRGNHNHTCHCVNSSSLATQVRLNLRPFRTFTATNTHTTYTATTDLPIPANKRRVKARAPNKALEARQATVSPTNIPAYASACSGAVRYSSACSCIGITATTTTVAAPSTTTTVQATVSLIRQAPGVVMNNYLDEQCIVANTDVPQMTVYADGTCYPIYESNSNINIQFSSGNCGVTAAQCTVTLYPQGGCAGTPLQSFPASNSVCFDTSIVYSANLVCPPC